MRIVAVSSGERWKDIEDFIVTSGADLAILPSGWSADRADLAPELSDGKLARLLMELGERTGSAVLASYAEREDERTFASVLLVDGTGRGLCSYRKTHLSAGDEARQLARGNWMTIVPLQGWRVGLALDDDLLHPEMTRCLALEGASLLLGVASFPRPVLRALALVRALENGVPCVLVSGEGVVAAGPDGKVWHDGPAESGLELPASDEGGQDSFATRRRVELYRALMEPLPRS
ncbi:carbon-nitrogen hydrolase family protein [Geminicoccus flavidas]|uniref:carbon-nitrogen hydrolase family protein n=1 Tax=Geminicoccus flavidas TaxID=2506407 RepID=UPI0013583E95|nr:carbon-nitrogen hydrolase family protein [Geminicoccus flavidas]